MRDLLMLLIPVVVASLTTVLFEKFQQGLTLLDKAPAYAKQILVTVLAFGLTKLAALLGVSLSSAGVVDLKPEDFSALLSSGLAFLFHNGAKTKALVAKVGMIALVLGLAACVPASAKANPPKRFVATALVLDDTLRLTAAPCQVSGNTTGCRVALVGTITPFGGGVSAAIPFAAVPDLAPNQTLIVTQAITCTDRATISVTVTSAGFNSGATSVARAATGTATCPAGAPVTPGAFTVQIIVVTP